MDIFEKLDFVKQTPVVSWHEHVGAEEKKFGFPEGLDIYSADRQIEVMDMMGVDISVISVPLLDPYCPIDRCRKANDVTYEALKRHPERYRGMAFVNPGFQNEALEELERCVKEYGFIGVKLYHQYRMDNPVQYALVEKCIELDIPILMHCGHCMDPGTCKAQPRISDGVHMANIAARYPEATFIMGHIGGGGDWQWSIKAIADSPNVFADVGGSVHDRPLIEESVRYLGADRLLFATDGSYASGVGKVLGADITEEEKKTIFANPTFMKYVERTGK